MVQKVRPRVTAHDKAYILTMARRYLRSLEDTNPILEKKLRKSREWNAEKASDAEYRLKKNQYGATWWTKNSQRQNMRRWLERRTQTELNRFTWKTHVPVVFAEAVRKTCASCEASHRRGLTVWWQRLASAETKPESVSEAESESQREIGFGVFDCHRCYTKDMQNALPLGREDFVFSKGRSLKP